MKRNVMIYALAGVAMAIGTPALAKPGGGGGQGHGKAGASVGAQVGVGVGRGGGTAAGATVGSDVSTTVGSSISTRGSGAASAGANSRGSINAGVGSAVEMRGTTSARSKANANAGASANVGTHANVQLTGVTNGMVVVDSGGATIGTVTGIHTVGNGKIRSVQVTLSDGQIITLSPQSLSIDGDVLATTSTTTNVNTPNASINGLINASPRSALASAGVTSLAGLTTGLVVNNSGGTAIGTVSQILVNRKSGAVVGVRVELDAGGTVLVPATSLSINGGIVTTTHINGGP